MVGVYQCIVCGHEFTSRRNAYNHVIKVHHAPRGLSRFYVEKINDVKVEDDTIYVDDVEVELVESDD